MSNEFWAAQLVPFALGPWITVAYSSTRRSPGERRDRGSSHVVRTCPNPGFLCGHPKDSVAEGLGVAWNTANDAVLTEGKRVLIDDEHRFDGVKVIGVDEHVWRHTRRGDKYVTVIIDLTPIREGTGPARLLDMVEGRSKQAFKTWLADRDQAWRDGVQVVAMDGFTGFKTATTEELPDAVAVMDPVTFSKPSMRGCRPAVPA